MTARAGRQAAARLAPTLAGCAVLLTVFVTLVLATTDGLERWTFEDVRRANALAGKIAASSLDVRTAEGTHRGLWPPTANDRDALVVGFFYTRCRTVCLTLGSEFARMQQALAAAPIPRGGRVGLVSLSVDVEQETPASLASYARLHGARAGMWTVAMPATPAAADRVLRELGVVAIPDGLGGLVHNGSLHVTTGSGRVLGIFDDADWSDALAAAVAYAGSASP